MRGIYLRRGLFGLLFGYTLSRVGFTDYDQLHAMFVFEDLRMFLTFASAVAIAAVGFLLARPSGRPAAIRLHPGIVPGAILFGIGWVMTGACPAIAPVQVGEGRFVALATIAGMLLGNFIYGRVHAKFFRWDPGSCEV